MILGLYCAFCATFSLVAIILSIYHIVDENFSSFWTYVACPQIFIWNSICEELNIYGLIISCICATILIWPANICIFFVLIAHKAMVWAWNGFKKIFRRR